MLVIFFFWSFFMSVTLLFLSSYRILHKWYLS